MFVTKWSTNGSLDGEFIRSQGVAVASDGSIYVSDTNNHQIQKFNSDGVFVIKWGTQGSGDWEFKSPVGVAVAFGGSVYVQIKPTTPSRSFQWGRNSGTCYQPAHHRRYQTNSKCCGLIRC